ncbi:Stromelysin-1 [Orchesella cincta]|uniref:Stromelysin-1 n=1 Tax=Orchesella cincta TaxID=48709 RepID=A0A1D2MFZ3_ORCCI|nr:Stromelysin-1 [Orchesella cincta]
MRWSLLHSYLYLVLFSGIGNAIPIVTNTEALKYMTTFGWLDPISDSIGSQPMIDVRKSVREFQAFAGLNITGELDEDTLELMSLPRCGFKWISRNLTYRISKYPRLLQTLGRDHIDAEINSAFEVWQKESNITFTRKTVGKVDIEIRFESRAHGDGDAFDGEGGTLAHAYFPRFGGDAHFDDDEQWTIKSHRGTNLFQVAAHEFGHSLGLLHSEVRDSLMAPFYRGYNLVLSCTLMISQPFRNYTAREPYHYQSQKLLLHPRHGVLHYQRRVYLL